MGIKKLLTPTFNGRGSAMGVSVKGDSIYLPKATALELGLRNKTDRLFFAWGGADDSDVIDRLYFLTEGQAKDLAASSNEPVGQGWLVNGSPDGRRYVKDREVIKKARLSSTDFTLVKDNDGFYLEFNPANPEPTFADRGKPGKKADGDTSKSDAAEKIKANRETGTGKAGDKPKKVA